ncbi:MAG: 2OG-Fe(II) oxygenase [Kofleriaceae bacterium]
MSLEGLRIALDKAGEKSWCEGAVALTEPLAIALPDGDLGAVSDAKFLDWLVEHSEPAPFGSRKETKVDATVRNAKRLAARGNAKIGGFDPANIIDKIEAALSPTVKLAATLTDVIVYPQGGKFDRHKDTPKTDDLVGTLVVEVPTTHAGGGLEIDDGNEPRMIDWSGDANPAKARWVALFSDVDHEIKPVEQGTRVTLVYSLTRTDKPRVDPGAKARKAALMKAVGQLSATKQWPVMIACSRQVVTEELAFPKIDALRGFDREIADAFKEAGFQVAVRACVFAVNAYETSSRSPQQRPALHDVFEVMRLKKPLTKKVVRGLDDSLMTFADHITSDDGDMDSDEMGNISLAKYIDDATRTDQWVVRAHAASTLVHECSMFSDDGYFGNEAYEALIYTLAALEIEPAGKRIKVQQDEPDDDEGDDDEDDDDDDDVDDDEDDGDDDDDDDGDDDGDDEVSVSGPVTPPTLNPNLILVEPAKKKPAAKKRAAKKPAAKKAPAAKKKKKPAKKKR